MAEQTKKAAPKRKPAARKPAAKKAAPRKAAAKKTTAKRKPAASCSRSLLLTFDFNSGTATSH